MLIASRVLKLRHGRRDVDVPIRVFMPEKLNDGSWSCQYEIGWPDKKRTANAGGVDSIQALLSALQMIGSEVYTTDYHKSGMLVLESRGSGYGFPVPTSLRDLLIGDDKKYL
jgi:hypothetical protein